MMYKGPEWGPTYPVKGIASWPMWQLEFESGANIRFEGQQGAMHVVKLCR